MTTMREWFGLKDTHDNFFVANDEDADVLFARAELDEKLAAILRGARRSNKPPKFVIYGDWGVGKTHVIRHVAQYLSANNEHNAYVVHTDLPDIVAKSSFQLAHAAILDALGLNTAKVWMLQYQTRFPNSASEKIQHLTQSEDVARAFLTLIGFGEGARIAWDWLRGVQLSAADARSAGLPQQLVQSNHMVNVHRMLGVLCEEVEGKKLVVMLDEADKLRAVTNGDAIAHWTNAFRILADKLTDEVGFIVAASFRDPDEMPDALADQQVRTRFGEDKYIMLPNFDDAKAHEFVHALVSAWIDESARETVLQEHGAETEGEAISEQTYPFTEEGLSVFVEFACRNGGVTTPRDIQEDLDGILNRAIDDARHILTSGYMHALTVHG